MPYKAHWNITLSGEGKVHPLDDDSIDKLYVEIIQLINSHDQEVDLKGSGIQKNQIEEY